MPPGARPATRVGLPIDQRLVSVDALRGLVMIIMALDHTRDFFHAGAMHYAPEDLTKTTVAVFLTRWVTHVCAPTFLFLAGLGAYLRARADRASGQTARFLWTRGVWLIVLELTVMRLAMNFTFDTSYPFLLITLWSLGASMIAMSLLVRLPHAAIAIFSASVILLHNTLDGVRPETFGWLAPVWRLLHVPGVIRIDGLIFIVGYPMLPFLAVMAAGYAVGPLVAGDAKGDPQSDAHRDAHSDAKSAARADDWQRPAHVPAHNHARRLRTFLAGGSTALLAMFVLLRAANIYGDPSPWASQSSAAFTLLSFLRVTKYPPSLLFVLMTLALAGLAWWALERLQLSPSHPLVVVGRVPLFYFLVHFWWLHILAVIAAFVRYGTASFEFLFSPLPSMGGALNRFPPDFGYSLAFAYAVWVFVVVSVYPLCRWYADLKRRRRYWWLSYL